jgi:hypothetical protein
VSQHAIIESVFALAARWRRRAVLLTVVAPVRQKRIGLSRGPQKRAMGFDCRRLAFRRAVMGAGKQVAAAKVGVSERPYHPQRSRRGRMRCCGLCRAGVGERGTSGVRPVRGAEPADRSGLGCRGRHEVSQIQRDLAGRARTSMTSMWPRPQAGQLVSDAPVRDWWSAR